MPDLRTKVLDVVGQENYEPVKPAVIAKKLGLADERARELKKIIKQMVKSGELAWGPSHKVFAVAKPPEHTSDGMVASATTNEPGTRDDRAARKTKSKPASDAKHLVGTFRRAAGGFGFVRP